MKSFSASASLRGLPQKGEMLDAKYQIGEVLGIGGMGVVVAAFHATLRQRVAVKFLTADAMSLPGASARFLREAQSAAVIQSEHVARVLDVGTLPSGAPYIVMEHLTGMHFGKLLKTRGEPLSVVEAIHLILQACEALAEAHSHGVVHRDLKLSNLFLTTRLDGAPLVKVLDFGLSKFIGSEMGGDPDEGLTATNLIAGSPYYMSPEQIRSLKYVDARTDIWSTGVILYELLTGHRPFRGEGYAAICVNISVDAPASLLALRPDVPGALEALIQRCLEKDVSRRVQNMNELAQGLAPFAAPQSLVSVDRISKLQHPAISTRTPEPGPMSSARGPAGSFPPIPPSVHGPPLSQADNPEFLPWLQGFDSHLRARRAWLTIDDKSVETVVNARSRAEESVHKVSQAEETLKGAADAVMRARLRLNHAQTSHADLKDSLVVALEERRLVFQDARARLSPILERLQHHDNITNAIKRHLGLSTSILPTPPAAPAAPMNLVAIAQPNRVHLLQWSFEGRRPGTQFLIHAAIGSIYRGVALAPEFSSAKLLTVTEDTTFRHSVARAQSGVQVIYRVRAKHGEVLSEYSNEVTVTCK